MELPDGTTEDWSFASLPAGVKEGDVVQKPVRTLRMGLLYERANLAFWTEVLEGVHDPERGAHVRRGGP